MSLRVGLVESKNLFSKNHHYINGKRNWTASGSTTSDDKFASIPTIRSEMRSKNVPSDVIAMIRMMQPPKRLGVGPQATRMSHERSSGKCRFFE